MRKTLMLLLAFILVFICVSCSSDENETFNSSIEDDSPLDFNGMKLVYMAKERDGRVEINPWEESEDSYWGDLLKVRYEEVEKKYNIEIEINKTDGLFTSNVLAGLDWADIYQDREDAIRPYIKSGMILALNDFDSFMNNLDDGMWGSKNTLLAMKRGDNYYGFESAFHGIPFKAMGGIFFANKTVMDRYGIDVFDMIESGKWTWDNFETVLESIGNDYSNPEGDIALLIKTAFPQYFCYCAAQSNGCEMVYEDENGRIMSNIEDPRFAEALSWTSHLIQDGLATYGDSSGYAQSSPTTRFADAKCGFWVEYSYVGTVDSSGWMYDDVDFIVAPCPCGPDGEYGNWRGYLGYADLFFSIPITADTDLVNAVLDDIYSPLGDEKYAWKDYFTKHYFLYEKSAEMYYTMAENATPVYSAAFDSFPFSYVASSSKTVSQVIEANIDRMQSLLDEYYNIVED